MTPESRHVLESLHKVMGANLMVMQLHKELVNAFMSIGGVLLAVNVNGNTYLEVKATVMAAGKRLDKVKRGEA